MFTDRDTGTTVTISLPLQLSCILKLRIDGTIKITYPEDGDSNSFETLVTLPGYTPNLHTYRLEKQVYTQSQPGTSPSIHSTHSQELVPWALLAATSA
jgi:hypothetical protein